jgi:hypothetical protein
MRTRGSKNLQRAIAQTLERTESLPVRAYNGGTLSDEHKKLIDSFTKNDFDLYQTYYKRYNKRGSAQGGGRERLVDALLTAQIFGPALELAKIRSQDNYTHFKIYQVLRCRWTDILAHKIKRINNNAELFWKKMARGIQTRCSKLGHTIDPDWIDDDGVQRLADYLQNLYDNVQEKLCAISHVEMNLELTSKLLGTNPNVSVKASPDRIDNTKGYVKGNIWLTAWWVNAWKGNNTLEEFYKKVDVLKQAQQQILVSA